MAGGVSARNKTKLMTKSEKKLLAIIIVLGCLGLLLTQWLTPTIWGADGYYHIRLAEMVKKQGVLKTLPQAKFSYFNGRFANKDFFYHWLLIPFTTSTNIFAGAKWAAWLFGSIFYASLMIIGSFYVSPVLWPLLGLGPFLSDRFLQTLARPRPMVLAITLGLWGVHYLIQKKIKPLLIVSLLYAWLHITAVLLLVYGLLIKIYRTMRGRAMAGKLIGAVLAALLIGFVVHPNFPNNWFYFYLNGILVPFLAAKTGVLELGGEFFPLNTRDYLLSYPLIVIGLLLMILIEVLARPKTRIATQIMILIAFMYVFMGFWSQRYIAHGYPFMMLSLGMFLTDWYKDKAFASFVKQIKKWINPLLFLGIMALLVLTASSFKRVLARGRGEKIINIHYEDMGKWLKKNVPPGELIFHANWSDSQYFIGLNPKNDYFVTMDPVYMWHKNPRLYQLYRAVAFGRIEDPHPILKDAFGVTYGYVGKNYFSALINQIRNDGRFEIVKEDQFGVIFKIKD
jgi:hypothetical protein